MPLKHLRRRAKIKGWEIYTAREGLFHLTQGDKEYIWNTFLPVIFAILSFTVSFFFLIPCAFFIIFQMRDVDAYDAYLDRLNQKKRVIKKKK